MAAATMYVTVAGAGDKSGSSWANAMDFAAFETDAEGSAEAGDLYYVYSGTYTLTNNLSTSRSGSSTAPIQLVGVSDQGTPPTFATGNDRPLFACGGNGFWFGNNWQIKNIRGTTTGSQGLRTDAATCVINCDMNNSSGSNRLAYYFAVNGGGPIMLDCKGKSTNGYAVQVYSGSGVLVKNCFFYDSHGGINTHYGVTIESCIFNNCNTGIYIGSDHYNSILNCTFYHCTTAISGSTGTRHKVINNIIEHDTGDTGASWTNEYKINYWDYNNWHGNGTDVSNVTKGPNATAHDPDFEDAAGGDFRLKTGSSCLTAGKPITLGVGASVTTHQGSVPPVAGGASGAVGSLFNGVISA